MSAFFESKHPKRVLEYMTFRLLTFLALSKSYCKKIVNALTNNTQLHQNSSKIHPKSTKMVPRNAPKVILEASWLRGVRGKLNFSDLWCHLGDFGRHLVPSWAPRGSQNLAFWHQDAPKCRKMRSRMRHQKKYEFLIEFKSGNVRF